jgi:signal recognition particle subunit SRP54
MKEICNALMNSDVNIKYVMDLRKKVSKEAKDYMDNQEDEKNAGSNIKKLILKIVVDELTVMLGSNNEPYKMIRGKPNVIMFVGL